VSTEKSGSKSHYKLRLFFTYSSIIVDAPGAEDGPGPSVIGSVDNVFKAIKDFDQYRCLERMLCEYMQEEGDVASALISNPIAGEQRLSCTRR
jgi:hypothetical protein